MRLLQNLIIIALISLGIAPILIYILHFSSGKLSNDGIDWSQFGTYLTGTLSPVIALSAALLAFAGSMIVNNHNINVLEKQQREKRPLATISYEDMENSVSVSLHNKGLGPFTITSYRIINTVTRVEYHSFFELINGLNFLFDNYTSDLTNQVLSSSECFNLIKLTGNDQNEEFQDNRDQLRILLGQLRIEIGYTDIYDESMPVYSRSLAWFNRHFLNMIVNNE